MLLTLLFLAAIAAWFISTVAAGGAVMLMIPLVSLLMSPQIVAPAVSLGAFIANPSRAWLFRREIHWPVAGWLVSGSLVGALLGAWLFTRMSVAWIQVLLGLFLISTVFQFRFGKSQRSFSMKQCWFFPLGVVVAFLSGLIGGTGPVHNPFLLNYGLEKEQLVATKAINSLAMQLTKLVAYTSFGAMTADTLITGVIIGLGGIIGVWLSHRHLISITGERFRRYTLAMMVAAGVLLLLKTG